MLPWAGSTSLCVILNMLLYIAMMEWYLLVNKTATIYNFWFKETNEKPDFHVNEP